MPAAAALLLVLLAPLPAAAADAKTAIEAFAARLARVSLADMTVTETFTLYGPDGRSEQASGERRLFVKIPRRQRVEETSHGRRAISVMLDGRMWVRDADGRVAEAPAAEARRARADLVSPLRHTGAELLALWRSLGVHDGVVHAERRGDRQVTVIGAGLGDRTSPAVWLDPEWGVVRLVVPERLRTREALVDFTLSDHRPVLGDFFYPFRQEVFVDGRLLTRVTVESVAVNTNLPDALFDPAALRRER